VRPAERARRGSDPTTTNRRTLRDGDQAAHYSVWTDDDLSQRSHVEGCSPDRAVAWLHLQSGAALLVLTDDPSMGELLAFHRDPQGRVRSLTQFRRLQVGGSPFSEAPRTCASDGKHGPPGQCRNFHPQEAQTLTPQRRDETPHTLNCDEPA